MAKIISKIDTKLMIPPGFKGLAGREAVEIEFKAGQIKEVSDKIADYYTRSRPKVFRFAEQEDFELYTEEQKKEKVPAEFDAMKFFEETEEHSEEAITSLSNRKHILAVCKLMGLSVNLTQTNDRIKERILSDIKIQKEAEEKLTNQ